MTTLAASGLMTAEEFARLKDPPHGGKMELVRGSVVIMPPVGPDHGERSNRAGHYLFDFVDSKKLGRVRQETGYWLSSGPDDVRAPDVSFVAEERVATEQIYHGFVTQPPDLAIEVVSPNDLDSEVHDKVDLYLGAGVPRVWVVRPAQRTVTVYRGDRSAFVHQIDSTLTSADAGFTVEGFALPLRDLFG
jgi:Uma2 family endonuclease